jgi:serine/threonine protein kinase/transcriptional regulator with XRE-family HTH domain
MGESTKGEDYLGKALSILQQASGLEGAERDDFIAAECAGDQELRRHLDEHLAEDDGPNREMAIEELAANTRKANSGELVLEAKGPYSGASSLGADLTRVREGVLLRTRYRLKRILGRGGMGVVWLAEDEELGQPVALKFLPEAIAKDRTAMQYMREEARVLLMLSHPGIVRLHNLDTDGSLTFLVMEYLSGPTLYDVLADRRESGEQGLSIANILRVIEGITPAIEFAHKQNVTHRDIKPANMMLVSPNKDSTPQFRDGVKLTDFGLAFVANSFLSEISTFRPSGTIPYMAPEILLGRKPTPASDLYALGATVYSLASGRPPFFRGDITTQVLKIPAPALESGNDNLDNAVAAALSKRPEDRPESASAFLALCHGQAPEAESSLSRSGEDSVLGPSRIAAILAGLALLLLTAFGAQSLLGRVNQPSTQIEPKLASLEELHSFREGFDQSTCLSCHQTSMELILGHAPELEVGYRAWQELGCSSCHTVSDLPDERRAGPPLTDLAQKLAPDFVSAWLASPLDFRPSTRMPHFAQLDEVSIAAITSFLVSQPRRELAAIPVIGDPILGKQHFRLMGCLACHSLSPFDGDPADIFDHALRDKGTNEFGPNLRGITAKVSREWLFEWIKNPSEYWPETAMPSLRLSDQEAADIVAYIFDGQETIFHDVPPEWRPRRTAYDRAELEDLARELLVERRGENFAQQELDSLLGTTWSADEDLLRAIGEWRVENLGCHSCHDVNGMRNMRPLRTSLTDGGEVSMDAHTTEASAIQYDLSGEEADGLDLFLRAASKGDVNQAWSPSQAEIELNTGLRVLHQKNCASCHYLDYHKIAFTEESGERQVVEGRFLGFPDDVAYPPPYGDFQDYIVDFEEYCRELFEDPDYSLSDLAIQLHRGEPGIGRQGRIIVLNEEVLRTVEMDYAWGGDFVALVVDHYLLEDDVEDVDGFRRAYHEEPWEKLRWTFAPPTLADAGTMFRRDWLYAYLIDISAIRPQMLVRMPSYNWEMDELTTVVNAFGHMARRRWASIAARRIRLASGATVEEAARQAGMDPELWSRIEHGDLQASELGLERLTAKCKELQITPSHPVQLGFEPESRRLPSHARSLVENNPMFFEQVESLVREGPNCLQCHFFKSEPPVAEGPIAWAPELKLTRNRLREDWLVEFIRTPHALRPGTSMPASFPTGDTVVWQEFFPGTSEEQVQAVVDWLYNFDE